MLKSGVNDYYEDVLLKFPLITLNILNFHLNSHDLIKSHYILGFSDLLWHWVPEFNQPLSSIFGFPLFHFTEHLFSCIKKENRAAKYLGANDTLLQKGKITGKYQMNLLFSFTKMCIFFIVVLLKEKCNILKYSLWSSLMFCFIKWFIVPSYCLE